MLLVVALFLHSYRFYAQQIPAPRQTQLTQTGSITFYTQDSVTVLHEVSGGSTRWVEVETLPDAVWQAALASSGESTVNVAVVRSTQALVDRALITEETHAFQRWVYVNELHTTLSQEELGEWIVNTQYYGNFAYGIQSAAQFYFGKDADDLTLAESATLAAIAQRPQSTDPIQLRGQRDRILAQMAVFGWLSEGEVTNAQRENIQFFSEVVSGDSILVSLAVQQLERHLGDVPTSDIEVITSIDSDLQQLADCQFAATPCPPGAEPATSNGFVLVLDASDGSIVAIAGSLEDAEANGRLLMPFVYLTAFEQGLAPSTPVLDVRTAVENGNGTFFIPENQDGVYNGPVSMRESLARGYDAPSLQVLERIGAPSTERTLRVLGLETNIERLENFIQENRPDPLRLLFAYSLFANNGSMIGMQVEQAEQPPQATILRTVFDEDETIIWQLEDDIIVTAIADPTLPYLVTDTLTDDSYKPVAVNGAVYSPRVATQARWTIGYSADVVVGLWTEDLETEAHHAAWLSAYQAAISDQGFRPVEEPIGIVTREVCETSGLLPTDICPRVEEVFREGTEPLEFDTFYQEFEINSATGLLATVFTPPQLIEERVFLVLPPEATQWAEEQGLPVPPQTYDVLEAPIPEGDVAILMPEPFSRLGDAVEVVGNASGDGFASYRLDYGQSFNPDEWVQIGEEESTSRTNSLLGEWDTSMLDGLYSLRLTVVYEDNSFEQFVTTVTIDNTPPELQLVAPADGDSFSIDEEFITIDAVAVDDIEMERVEFYVDEQLVASRTETPFSDRWIITSPGEHTVRVQAIDSTGNVSSSEIVTINVEGG